jgi:error-prone DNA polymerase
MSFVHLNVHSHYSMGWGMGTIEALCRSAKEQGMDRLALTDTNGVYGLIFFLQIAKEVGIQPIVGSELTTEDHRAVLLVKNHEGYANLCRTISDRHCHQGFDFISSLKARRQGLIILSDDFKLLKALKRENKEDLFVEMSPGYSMHKCYAFSRESKIPPLATNRVYLITKEQFRLHQFLRAVALNTKLSRLTYGDTCRPHNILNSPQDMMDQFPHAPHAVLNTFEVANACLSDWDFSQIIFPHFERMTDEEAYQRLYRATMDGCRRRYGTITREVRNRVEHEMNIIKEKNFAHYFLVVADMTKRSVRSCGRGSAAASIVSYALGITHVDPIKHNLFFERFLNLGRMDPPDIDIDFAWDERDQIMDYAFAKYGNRRAAMVANHNTFGARSAIREVAKVFGLTEAEINRVTRRVGFGWRLRQVWSDLKNHPKMRDIEFKRPWDEILSTAAQLEDHLNHLSVHCGGLVVVPDEIRRYCPVEISANGVQVLQWEKDSVEESGLVKIDILGNRSLAVIRDALALVEKNSGLRIDYATWNPIDDPKTVEIFYRGDTFGVFYFESPATRQTLVKVGSGFTLEEYLHMDHFHLNVVVTSIIRPASNPSIRTWVSRLHGRAWDPPHPLLRPVLKETLGVMVFQEQLSQAAIHLAGFDPAEADILRKVVSKKYKEKKLRDFQTRFERGALKRGVNRKTIKEVWQMMMGFDGYSFCKPHSASYTLVAYKSAFLRAHYPAEFMASVISNGGGYYSPLGYLSEARRMGLKILPPDINQSEIKYTGRDKEIRVGLMQLKDLTQEAKEAIIRERSKHGPFLSLVDFLERTESQLHLQDIRVLIKAGCFDRIAYGIPRPGLVWQALRFFETPTFPSPISLPFPVKNFSPKNLEYRMSNKEPQNTDPQSNMYPAQLSKIPTLQMEKGRNRGRENYALKYVPASYPKNIMLKHETETLGFLLSIHPLERYNHILKGLDYVKARDLQSWAGKRVSTVGWMVTGKTVRTKDGDSMKFVSFEDPTGIYEAVFFPEVYHRYCNMLNGSRAYIIKGRVEEDFGAISVQVHWIGFLDKFKGGFSVDTRKRISYTSTQMG